MSKAIHDKKSQIEWLTNRMNLLLKVLESIEPEEADVEDIDKLLQMVDDIQDKINQFRPDW
ncbi:SE1561 family protein [Calidifontibacillus oryziterrae]|uniref:SE1561 family protein n=1 Tax=Calidifontibacillus oryziterrae TaxID=1191699 RepID=UPI0003072BD3|nr:SE1561 family protein [Calidifontibacillus oryziterrae]